MFAEVDPNDLWHNALSDLVDLTEAEVIEIEVA